MAKYYSRVPKLSVQAFDVMPQNDITVDSIKVAASSFTSKLVAMTGMMLWNTKARDRTGRVLGTALMSALIRA